MTTPDIEARVEEYNREVYDGNMPLQNKEVLRKLLVAEDRFWTWEARDYVYGQDEGEPPTGAQW